MRADSRLLWIVVALATAAVAVVGISLRVVDQLAPQPRRAWVAIQVGRSGEAEVGPVELPAGRAFTLHAVLEAEGRDGERLFFTDAPGLVLDGEPLPPEAIRRWGGPLRARVLWFTVEGPGRYMEVSSAADLDRFRLQEVLQPDWPFAWSIPGELGEAPDGSLRGFGTLMPHVRVELFGEESEIRPRHRLMSPRAEAFLAGAEGLSSVSVTLPGLLVVPSRVFGLTQVEVEGTETLGDRLLSLYARRLAFSRLLLLRDLLRRAGRSWDELDWLPVELAKGPAWGRTSVQPGHLLRVGERVVVLYRDEGADGRLDYDDLCLDFLDGAAVRALREVFTGEGLVEWAAL